MSNENESLPQDTDAEIEKQEFSADWVGKISYWIFHYRKPLLILFILITILLGAMASQLRVQAGFTKMIPLKHPYMATFLEYQSDFGGANRVLVALKNTKGEIYEKNFMEKLRKVTEEVFFIKGVERSSVTSLFSPNVRYNEVVEDGFRGGNIVAADFAGTKEQLRMVRENLLKSDWVGRIVSNDQTSAMVVATLMENDPETGERLDLQQIAGELEKIRAKYEDDNTTVHIIGFAKAMGDIAKGAAGVLVFFGVAFVITAVLLYWYSGSFMITSLALICAIVPVIWLLGLLPVFGLGLDPMSILVPFLIFSIAVSHAVQMTNAWKLEMLHGVDGITASTHSFQKLFIPGAMALLANALGFMVIAFVEIEIVRELAFTATIGVTVMIITNKMLLPILLSYYRFSPEQASKLAGKETAGDWLWERIGGLATKKVAWVPILAGLGLLAFGISQARHLHIGDLGKGVPELRENSRYNQDVDMITSHFAIGVDLLQVIVEAKPKDEDDSPCVNRDVMDKVEDFEFQMRQVDGVATVRSLAGFVKSITQSFAETFAKWRMLPEERAQIAQGVGYATRLGNEFMNSRCTAMPVSIFTTDHQATTIEHIVDKVKAFNAGGGNTDRVTFRLASGNVGVMAATNEAVEAADKWVNLALFASVMLLCLITFRSFPITLCIVLPLALVTVLCNGADGDARHRCQGQHAAGRGARCGCRRRLRHLSVRAHEARDGRRRARAEGRVRRGIEAARHRVGLHGGDHDRFGRHLDVLGAEVPGRHGHPALLHVPREHVRRDPAAAGTGGLHGRGSPQEARKSRGESLRNAPRRRPGLPGAVASPDQARTRWIDFPLLR